MTAGCSRPPAPGSRTAYGDDPSQWAELYRPEGTPRGVVVVIHGGFWRAQYDASLGAPLAEALAAEGWAAWNLEYRRVGNGGGVPATLDDVAAGIDALAEVDDLDLSRVVTLGHSAGGHLAAWAASRSRLQAPAPGADPVVVPAGVVAQAGVLDLVAAARQNLGGGAAQDLLGGDPVTQAARYAVASPAALVPASCPVVAVHGTADGVVPIDQSRRYVATATAARGQARLVELPGVDHFQLIDPAEPAWRTVRDEVLGLLR